MGACRLSESIEFVMEFGAWGGHYKRLHGASWRAMFVESATGERYAGSDDSPWIAIAWAMHERALRQRGGHAMARNEGDLPDGVR